MTATAVAACSHHWIIETPDGPTSPGVCSLCGQEREFTNHFDDPYGDFKQERMKPKKPRALTINHSQRVQKPVVAKGRGRGQSVRLLNVLRAAGRPVSKAELSDQLRLPHHTVAYHLKRLREDARVELLGFGKSALWRLM